MLAWGKDLLGFWGLWIDHHSEQNPSTGRADHETAHPQQAEEGPSESENIICMCREVIHRRTLLSNDALMH